MTIEYDDNGKLYTNIIHKTSVAAAIQTAIHRIQGHIHLADEQTLKEKLEQNEPFLAATDSTINDPKGETLDQNKFLLVQRSQITWIIQDVKPSGDNKEEPV